MRSIQQKDRDKYIKTLYNYYYMDTMPGMDGRNFDHYDNYNYNDTGELSQPPSFENTALSMIGIIIFISFYSTLCGICRRNNRRIFL